MTNLEQLAAAALGRESLRLRALTQDFQRETENLSGQRRPATDDPRILAIAASLIELFAERRLESAPAWAEDVSPLVNPFFLVEAAGNMKRLRELCMAESPPPLRKRNLFAPPDFLSFA